MVRAHVFFVACSLILEGSDHRFYVIHGFFIFDLFPLTLSLLDHAEHHMFFVLMDQLSHISCNVI